MRALLVLLATTLLGEAPAAVVVLANHTDAPVKLEAFSGTARQEVQLAPGESKPLFSTAPLTIQFVHSSGRITQRVSPDSAYRFAKTPGARGEVLQLRRIGLGQIQAPPPTAWQAGVGRGDAPIRVLLCVDEEEPMRRELWTKRLQERLAEAGKIIREHSGVRLEVAGHRTWNSTNSITRFEETLAEFERAIRPEQGELAIGFSSQYRVERGRHRMGGTRGPLRDHILIKEWGPRVSEAERVELLVHELGHFLGAAHSPEATSVMRPVVGNRPVRLRDEPIRFDPVNTLAIAMVGEEVRGRGIRRLSEISRPRRLALQRIYGVLSAITPGEPAAAQLLRALNVRDAPPREIVSESDRLEAASAAVVAAVTQTAVAYKKLPASKRLAGDELTNHLARAGAEAANSPKALLVGLAVALDRSGGLRIHPRTRKLAAGVESDTERTRRLGALGRPTARDRPDTLKHFVVSAALAALLGEQEANLWGVSKELADAGNPSGTGFSFADLAADRAGVRFARGVLKGSPPVAGLARSFRIENYVPSLDGLEEGLSLDELIDRYGGQGDPRFEAVLQKIDERIESLPAYSLGGLQFTPLAD